MLHYHLFIPLPLSLTFAPQLRPQTSLGDPSLSPAMSVGVTNLSLYQFDFGELLIKEWRGAKG